MLTYSGQTPHSNSAGKLHRPGQVESSFNPNKIMGKTAMFARFSMLPKKKKRRLWSLVGGLGPSEKYERQLGWWQKPNINGKMPKMATSYHQPGSGCVSENWFFFPHSPPIELLALVASLSWETYDSPSFTIQHRWTAWTIHWKNPWNMDQLVESMVIHLAFPMDFPMVIPMNACFLDGKIHWKTEQSPTFQGSWLETVIQVRWSP